MFQGRCAASGIRLSGGHIWTTPAGRTWPPALLALCTSIHRFSGSREGTPYPLTRVLSPFSTGLGCSYSSHPSRGTHLDALVTGQHRVLSLLGWSTRAIGCEPPARDERICPPGGEPLRVEEYRRTFPLWAAGTGLPAAKPLRRRPQSNDKKFLTPFLNNYTAMKDSPRTC